MRQLTVIIPSRSAGKLQVTIPAIRRLDPTVRILVADDGVDWDDMQGCLPDVACFVPRKGGKFVFSRAVNTGIQAAPDDDVVLLNDDAVLGSRWGFRTMQQASHVFPEYGLIGATCNNIGQASQFPQGVGLRDEPRMVCFVCVFIPRTTIETVGLLDERFVDYGMDDDDYCLRVRQAGLKLGIHDSCFVDHLALESDYRGRGGGDYQANLNRFIEKWGHDQFGRAVGRKVAL